MRKSNKVEIKYQIVKTKFSSYTCPLCNTIIYGAGLTDNITRFKCLKCGKELVVQP